MHARWAMLGVAGMAAPEIFGNPLVDGPLPNNPADAPFYDGYIADANTLFICANVFDELGRSAPAVRYEEPWLCACRSI